MDKHKELMSLIKESYPDIIALSEVKAKRSLTEWDARCFLIPGYNIETKNVQEGEGRGMMMYIKDTINYSMEENERNVCEAQVIKIPLQRGRHLLFASIYRSPNSTVENNRQINELIVDVSKSRCSIVIAGDMNYPGINWDRMSGTTEKDFHFIETVRNAYLVQNVDRVTRGRSSQQASLLDLVLTKEHQLNPRIEYHQPLGKSDHSLLEIIIRETQTNECKEKTRPNIYRGNYERMKQVLDIDWQQILEEERTVEDKWMKFKNIMDTAIDRCIPKMKVRRKILKNVPVDQKTLSKIRRKKRLWKQYLETGSEGTYLDYCRTRNQVRSLTRKNMKKLEKNIAKEAKKNPKKFWAYANQKTKNKESIPQLSKTGNIRDGELTENNLEKAQVLASLFDSVFIEEPPGHWELPPSTSPAIDQELNINENTVLELLAQLDKTKSPGPDGMHPKILYEIRNEIALPLSIIYNYCLAERSLPQDWKEANITAIHKKGSKQIANNYRPVSLTSLPCKILEKFVRRRIMDHLMDNNILSHKQFGFISGRSTLLQLLMVLDEWTAALDRGSEVDVVFLDFKKAFDRVPHQRLLDKLQYYGIDGHILAWISAFLQGRRQRVCLHDAASSWSEVKSGIPQGSVLGPVLFIIFINSLPETTISPTFLFADDAKIFREITNPTDQQSLQQDINNMYSWTEQSLLTFNPDKCVSMTISRSGNNNRQYKLNGTPLNISTSERDLGVIIDNRLQFNDHVQAKINKSNSIMALIRKTYTFLDNSSFLLLYKSLVRPHLEYANQIWKPHLKKHIHAIENVQRRATRLLPGMQNLTYEERLKKLKLPTLEYRRTRGDMIEAFKITSGHYKHQAIENFLPLNNRTSRGHSKKLHHQQASIDLRKYSFTHRIVETWNSLPSEVINAPSIQAFERRLDKYWLHHHQFSPYRPPQ